jgi:exosortase/archaeosortase family protein
VTALHDTHPGEATGAHPAPRRGSRRAGALRGLRVPAGAALLGYGLLVVTGVLPHDAPVAGAASLLLGALLLLPGLPEVRTHRAQPGRGPPNLRRHAVAVLGAGAVGGVLAWEAWTGTGFSTPELLLLAYGAALLLAARHLDARLRSMPVATLVGWSFPLLLAPLLLFSLNAVASSGTGTTAASPLINLFLVKPTAWGLALLGTPNEVVGNNLLMETRRGSLAVAIGLVCAGLYPMVLFGGILALHGWQHRVPPKRLAAYLAGGLLGLWVFNLLRLVTLAKVGVEWGAGALTFWHAHLGWILFALFMTVFWAVVLRKVEAPRGASPPGTAG